MNTKDQLDRMSYNSDSRPSNDSFGKMIEEQVKKYEQTHETEFFLAKEKPGQESYTGDDAGKNDNSYDFFKEASKSFDKNRHKNSEGSEIGKGGNSLEISGFRNQSEKDSSKFVDLCKFNNSLNSSNVSNPGRNSPLIDKYSDEKTHFVSSNKFFPNSMRLRLDHSDDNDYNPTEHIKVDGNEDHFLSVLLHRQKLKLKQRDITETRYGGNKSYRFTIDSSVAEDKEEQRAIKTNRMSASLIQERKRKNIKKTHMTILPSHLISTPNRYIDKPHHPTEGHTKHSNESFNDTSSLINNLKKKLSLYKTSSASANMMITSKNNLSDTCHELPESRTGASSPKPCKQKQSTTKLLGDKRNSKMNNKGKEMTSLAKSMVNSSTPLTYQFKNKEYKDKTKISSKSTIMDLQGVQSEGLAKNLKTKNFLSLIESFKQQVSPRMTPPTLRDSTGHMKGSFGISRHLQVESHDTHQIHNKTMDSEPPSQVNSSKFHRLMNQYSQMSQDL